ncbi:FitA-like ribbon-helix-helix domain-containing protein [Thiococcus pfennigii]|uniref:FitA-like ribbon-helix-helix domain-containing protein n=1 Tax=Thiococcus pfennigii TaxID=1057 RepID=UPI003B8335D7
MATLMVRNLPDHVHRALRLCAAEHGRSTEGEVCAILAERRSRLPARNGWGMRCPPLAVRSPCRTRI